MIYFDTTYLVRCYLDEDGASEVRALGHREIIACCELGQAELCAAFHRKLREGALTAAEFAVVARQFEAELRAGRFTWLPGSAALLSRVRETFLTLPASVFLRAADALHLVCAREAGLPEIYTNDRHMLAAASHFGLRGVNVIATS